MQKHLILTIFVLSSISMTAQENDQKFIIKTNVLNFIIIPSLHIEFRITDKSSVVLNFHRGKLVFFSENNWINASIDYKKYLSRKPI